MKFSEIITEQYENQDPHRPADETSHGDQHWYDRNGLLHRDGDLPATIWRNGDKYWHKNEDVHRELGPAVVRSNGNVEFWLNDIEYSSRDAWAREVKKLGNLRKHEIIIMKHRIGLD
jgi:hypothetical protein